MLYRVATKQQPFGALKLHIVGYGGTTNVVATKQQPFGALKPLKKKSSPSTSTVATKQQPFGALKHFHNLNRLGQQRGVATKQQPFGALKLPQADSWLVRLRCDQATALRGTETVPAALLPVPQGERCDQATALRGTETSASMRVLNAPPSLRPSNSPSGH